MFMIVFGGGGGSGKGCLFWILASVAFSVILTILVNLALILLR
jgi:hypothetical protein